MVGERAFLPVWALGVWVAQWMVSPAAAQVLGTRVPADSELTPIRAIQYTQFAAQLGELADECYSSKLVGQEVIIKATVTARTDTSLFVQEASSEWAAVEVYFGAGAGGFDTFCPPVGNQRMCIPGDVIYVNGVVREYFGMTRVKVQEANIPFLTVMTQSVGANATLGSTGTTLVPITVTTGLLGGPNRWLKGAGCNRDGELYEGSLVKISNVIIQEKEFDKWGQILIDDGTGPCVMENDLLNTDAFFANALANNAELASEGLRGVFVQQIVGVVQYSAADGVPKFEVVPRTTDDIVLDADAIRGTLYDYSAPAPPPDLDAWKAERDVAFAVGLSAGILVMCGFVGLCWIRECYAERSLNAYLKGEQDGLRAAGGVDIENTRDWERNHNGARA